MYDAYGQVTTTRYPLPFSYGGQWGYQTQGSLILCTHRYYDLANGRWLTRDPIGYAGGVNLYGYCGNDPGNRWDANGYGGSSRTGISIILRLMCAILGTCASLKPPVPPPTSPTMNNPAPTPPDRTGGRLGLNPLDETNS